MPAATRRAHHVRCRLLDDLADFLVALGRLVSEAMQPHIYSDELTTTHVAGEVNIKPVEGETTKTGAPKVTGPLVCGCATVACAAAPT